MLEPRSVSFLTTLSQVVPLWSIISNSDTLLGVFLRISRVNGHSQKQQIFLYFTIKLFWISGKGWLTSSRSIPDLSSPIAPAHRKTGKIIDCQYSVIVSSFFLMNVLSFLCLFSNVMCLFMPFLFWVNLCRLAFSLKLRFKHLLNKGSLFFFTIRYFLPRSLQEGCSLIYSTQYFLVTLNI